MNAPLTAGLGLKPPHYDEALDCTVPGIWFEVHPENYYVDGGPRHAWLEAIRARHPVALHSVSLSLAAAAAPDPVQLERLAQLARRIDPVLVSEHLAWSAWRGDYHPDLLPFPRTTEALQQIAANVSRTQDSLGRRIALENPAHYLQIPGHEWDEVDFLSELCRRTGCGLLLDVNNVHVAAYNLGYSAAAYIDRFPGPLLMEIHLAGHSPDLEAGSGLLIDSHGAAVAEEVWALYHRLLARVGARPTLLERDANVPGFAELLEERSIADALLRQILPEAA